MQNKYLKNIITSFLVVMFVFTPFLQLKIAKAQTTNGAYNANGAYGGNGGGTFGGINGYISGLAPAIAQLPLCKEKLSGGIQKLFTNTGAKDAYEQYLANIGEGDDNILSEDEFYNQVSDGVNQAESVQVTNPSLEKKTDKIAKDQKNILETVKSTNENDTCLKSIGRIIIKMLLQKITISTVAWIQGGFEGGPAFIENPGEFFGDIAKNEIVKFGVELMLPGCNVSISGNLGGVNSNIDDLEEDCISPFAKTWLRRQAIAVNKQFADNARYSLNELMRATNIPYTDVEFSADFAMGGWDAWNFMTSVPANNAFGFDVLATEELSFRLSGTAQSKANNIRDQLQEAGGFLGDERCVDPKGLTREEHNNAMLEGEREVVVTQVMTINQYGDEEMVEREVPTGYIKGACKNDNWRFVTPGELVAKAAHLTVDFPTNNLLSADDLNQAIFAISDALLSRFSNDLMAKGFANISTSGSNGQFVLNDAAYGVDGYIPSRTESDYYRTQMSNWLKNNPNFNVRTDLTQSFIDTQRTYVQKLNLYSQELEDLIRTTHQLSFCVPGPASNWKEIAYQKISDVSKEITNTPNDSTGSLIRGILTILKSITILVSPFGLGVALNVGNIVEGIFIIIAQGSPEDFLARNYYAAQVALQTGMRFAPSAQTGTKGDAVNILETVIESYDKAIKKTFTGNRMPTVTRLANGEERKIIGYQKIIEQNEEEIAIKSGVITQLIKLKAEIEEEYDIEINSSITEDPDFPIDQELLNRFARLAGNLVDGNRIAELDKKRQEARDHRTYVWEDLLIGPYGCETQMFGNSEYPEYPVTDERAQLEEETGRRMYPEEIFTPYPGHEYGLYPLVVPTCAEGLMLDVEHNVCYDPPEPPVCLGTDIPIEGVCMSLEVLQMAGPGQDTGDQNDPDDGIFDDGSEPNPDPVDPPPPSNQIVMAGILGGGTWNITNGVATWGGYNNGQLGGQPNSGFWSASNGSGSGQWTATWFGSGVTGTIITGVNQLPGTSGTWIGGAEYGSGGLGDPPGTIYGDNASAPQPNMLRGGFLLHGYYESSRQTPADAIENQTVRIPRGVLDLDTACPILKIKEQADKGLERAYNQERKSCKKAKNRADGQSESECKNLAKATHENNKKKVAKGQELLNQMCNFRQLKRDSVLWFENSIEIY